MNIATEGTVCFFSRILSCKVWSEYNDFKNANVVQQQKVHLKIRFALNVQVEFGKVNNTFLF